MCEVLVNCCHLEIKIEDAQKRLKPLQEGALEPLQEQVERMSGQSKDARFRRLCAWTWDNLREEPDAANPWRQPSSLVANSGESGDEDADGFSTTLSPTLPQRRVTRGVLPFMNGSVSEQRKVRGGDDYFDEDPQLVSQFASEHPEVLTAEAEVLELERLLHDTRRNAAAVVCSRMQHEKSLGLDWGRHMLTLLVSEEYAGAAIKKLKRSQPQAYL
jgi:hypothetical protein